MLSQSIHRLAERELNEAAQHYERERPGLGLDFIEQVKRCLGAILDFPMLGAPIALGVRRRLLHRFPYAIIYSVKPDCIRVLAVMHLKRKPTYWVGRT